MALAERVDDHIVIKTEFRDTTDPHCTLRANTLSDVYSTSTETDTAASLTRADSAAES